MATKPKPDLPSADECVRRAWQAAQEAQSRGLPMSSQAVWWQESQAWSLLSIALRGQPLAGLAQLRTQSITQPPTPAPVTRHKSGPKPKPKPDIPKSNFDVVEELRRKWEQEG